MRNVGIGSVVIRRGDKVLVGLRPEGKIYPGKWEFPGGKVEAGESHAEAALREANEEVGLSTCSELRLLGRARFDPPQTIAHVDAALYMVDVGDEAEFVAHVHAELRWVTIAEFGELDCNPAMQQWALSLLLEA